MEYTDFHYSVFIKTNPVLLWNALIDKKITSQYWEHENSSDFRLGSRWEHRRLDAAQTVVLAGQVLDNVPGSLLKLSWAEPADFANFACHSVVTLALRPIGDWVELKLSHEKLEKDSAMSSACFETWPIVLSTLKTLLETGQATKISTLKNAD